MGYLPQKILTGLLLSGAAVTVLFLSGCGNRPLPEANLQDGSGGSLSDGGTPSALSDNGGSSNGRQENGTQPDTGSDTEESMMEKMTLQIGNSTFTATLENNAAVDAFMEMMKDAPVVIQMSDYAGFEKVGSLETGLPTDDSRTTAHAGDIVLYNGNQIVIFYGTNSWSYTRIGRIEDLSGWEDAFGSGDVTVIFSLG